MIIFVIAWVHENTLLKFISPGKNLFFFFLVTFFNVATRNLKLLCPLTCGWHSVSVGQCSLHDLYWDMGREVAVWWGSPQGCLGVEGLAEDSGPEA